MTWAHKARGSEGGEPDETGFPREGYQLGDLAGAVSLAIPMELYETEAADRALMGEIRRHSVSLLGTINNTLDAASLEAGRYRVDIAPLDVLDVVNAVEATVAPLAAEKGVAFTADIDPRFPLVLTDPSILHKILMNLLSNAVKFTGEGGSVRLTVALTAARDGLLIEVADTGIGIPEDELATIFERFRQADSSISRRYGGSGLGLALVKEMAELLGGRATVQSEVGVGSVFRASHPGAVMGKDELIEELWGEEYLDGAISIAVYVRKIREKIEENPAKPAYLKTVWGVGYSFEA